MRFFEFDYMAFRLIRNDSPPLDRRKKKYIPICCFCVENSLVLCAFAFSVCQAVVMKKEKKEKEKKEKKKNLLSPLA